MTETARERVWLESRRHGIVLARPLLRALVVAVLGGVGFLGGWPISAAGAALVALAAGLAVAAVWRWDRTQVVVTRDELAVVHGLVRRRSAAVPLARVGAVEVEQSLLGRLLGYGTIVAGDLEITCVPEPARVRGLLDRARAAH